MEMPSLGPPAPAPSGLALFCKLCRQIKPQGEFTPSGVVNGRCRTCVNTNQTNQRNEAAAKALTRFKALHKGEAYAVDRFLWQKCHVEALIAACKLPPHLAELGDKIVFEIDHLDPTQTLHPTNAYVRPAGLTRAAFPPPPERVALAAQCAKHIYADREAAMFPQLAALSRATVAPAVVQARGPLPRVPAASVGLAAPVTLASLLPRAPGPAAPVSTAQAKDAAPVAVPAPFPSAPVHPIQQVAVPVIPAPVQAAPGPPAPAPGLDDTLEADLDARFPPAGAAAVQAAFQRTVQVALQSAVQATAPVAAQAAATITEKAATMVEAVQAAATTMEKAIQEVDAVSTMHEVITVHDDDDDDVTVGQAERAATPTPVKKSKEPAAAPTPAKKPKPKKITPKKIKALKRPVSGFGYYTKAMRASMGPLYVHADACATWKAFSDAEKQPWNDIATEKWAKYRQHRVAYPALYPAAESVVEAVAPSQPTAPPGPAKGGAIVARVGELPPVSDDDDDEAIADLLATSRALLEDDASSMSSGISSMSDITSDMDDTDDTDDEDAAADLRGILTDNSDGATSEDEATSEGEDEDEYGEEEDEEPAVAFGKKRAVATQSSSSSATPSVKRVKQAPAVTPTVAELRVKQVPTTTPTVAPLRVQQVPAATPNGAAVDDAVMYATLAKRVNEGNPRAKMLLMALLKD